jgi:PTH1 family peptidyl-tRNA hydrolase
VEKSQAKYNLFVGLGNPGKEYENTRHNVGFAIIDAFCKKHKIDLKEEKNLSAICGRKKIDDNEIIIACPTTFMNNSGHAVSKILNWYKIPVVGNGRDHSLLVIHDEIALDLGRIRISHGRGAGGHHGIESIINQIGGSKDFTRIRIGVGPDPGGDIRADYVLGKFTNKEKKIFEKVTELSIEAMEMLMKSKVEDVMNKYNGMEVLQ